MHHIIAGTAGHIDHGKTALIRALTGIDTDRLEEEKRRGISIDLGFAHLDLPGDIRLGFVDVPGHERFIKNMLAGVAGIDLVLFIVAADESIKPQTREHFEICRLLGIPKGIVVLTKADLVDPDILGLVRLEIEELVAGSFLEGAPVVEVSSLTGAGIEQLRGELAQAARTVRAKDATRPFRLPIDRSFSMRGHGSVVTGTLIAGSVGVEDEIEIHPIARRVRVRGIQVHGKSVERAFAGERTALNLAGIDSGELRRGMTLSAPGLFHPTNQIDTMFQLLPGAHPLKHRAPVHFHLGTAEVEAVARLLESLTPMTPGTRAPVRFILSEPLLILPGDRFIIRMFSPVVTIGGGLVVDIDAPPRIKRTALADRVKRLENASPADRVATLVRESRYGMSDGELAARTGLPASEIAGGRRWLVDPDWARQSIEKLRSMLADFHRRNPLQPGIAKEELRSREFPGAPPFLLDMLLSEARDIVATGELVRLASHKLALKQDEEEALGRIEKLFQDAGLAVPSTTGVLAKSGVETARARSLLQILLRNRQLLRISEDLVFHASAVESLRALLAGHRGARFSVAEFKEWTGVSRKYAIPLLEFLDRERVTRREGDSRVVL